MTELSTLLAAARNGDAQAAGSAFSLLYDDVRRLARSRLRQHRTMTLLDTTSLVIAAPEKDVLRVHDALEVLAQVDERLAQIVEMRYFGGLTEAEIAEALGLSDRTVRRDWDKARLLLTAELQ